jgi:hypothetical protein
VKSFCLLLNLLYCEAIIIYNNSKTYRKVFTCFFELVLLHALELRTNDLENVKRYPEVQFI